MLLADGGLWSNLAIAWFTHGRHLVSSLDPPQAPSTYDVDLHLVVDATVSVRPQAAQRYTWPVIGRGLGAYRSAQALLQSTVVAQRQNLGWHSQWNPGGPVSHVRLDHLPDEICQRAALMQQVGGSQADWRDVASRAASVKTTLSPLDVDEARSLVALGYGNTAAHLAEGWSVPFSRFASPLSWS